MSLILDGSNGVTFPAGSNPQAAPSKVLQVVQNSYSTETSNATTTLADTGLSVSITPLFSTSKILVIASMEGAWQRFTNTFSTSTWAILRNSTNIMQVNRALGGRTGTSASGDTLINSMLSFQWLDSPATTSSVTYKMQFCVTDSTSTTSITAQQTGSTSVITLLEIAQ